MRLPIYRTGKIDLECPCCQNTFTATKEPIMCLQCSAMLELYVSQADAQEHADKCNGTAQQGPDNTWIVAYCSSQQNNSSE